MMRATMRVLIVLAVLSLLAACGSSSSGNTCPSDVPSTCSTTPPSWQGEVQAVVQRRCASCHSSRGAASSHPFSTWAEANDHQALMLDQLATCRMPPAGASALTSTERAALVGWLVCGAPNN